MAADLQTQGFESVQWYLEGISAWAGTQCICGIIHSKNVSLLTIILRGQESYGMVVSGMLRVIVQQNVSYKVS